MISIKQLLAEDNSIPQVIDELRKKEVELPNWDDLKKEYDPKLHPVMDLGLYPDKPGKKGVVKVTRTTRGLQRRAVKIMTGMMFGIPVGRIYQFNGAEEERAAKLLENIITANRIDTVNINRSIKLFAACEAATLWYAIKEPNNIYGEQSPLKLKCRIFSPMGKDRLFPLFDEYGDMVAFSLEYTRTENKKTVTYFDTYTATEHYKWRNLNGEWEEIENDDIAEIGKIPIGYITRETPVWEDSNNITEIEWAYSRNGNYLRRNSVPVFEIKVDNKIDFGNENDDDERVILQLSANGSSGYQTWQQAIESLKFHTEGLERAFFSDIQLPNLSFEEMKSSAQSGESKRYMFMEAQIKVLEEQGAWLELFSREISVIKSFAKIMFPGLAGAFDAVQVTNVITPFSMTDEKDTVNNVTNAVAGKIASRKTGVDRYRDWETDRKSTRLNSSHSAKSRMPSSA